MALLAIGLGSYWYLRSDGLYMGPSNRAQTTVATPTPDAMTVRSPALANEMALPTPTPRPTATPIPAGALVAEWPSAQPLAVDNVAAGTLTLEDGLMQDGTYFDLYEFAGAPGQIITLDLSSAAFDTVLMLANSSQEVIAYNDDFYKDNTNSRLVLPVPAPDTYQVIVNTFDVLEGDYTLQLAVTDARQPDNHLAAGEPAHGWLIPGDETTPDGLYVDRWVIQMPEEPLVVWARSTEFDVRLDAFDPAGNLLVKNGDLDAVGLEYDARILLAPGEQSPPGSEVTLAVALQGAFAVGGAYELLALPLPAPTGEKAVVTVRPVIVHGADGEGGSQATPEQVKAAVARANAIWQTCGIGVASESDTIETVAMPGLEGSIEVNRLEWTEQEALLMTHPSHTLPQEGVITAYFVRDIDNGERYGISYPSTRYPAGRSGILLVADSGATDEAFVGTLAHELGHMLGLNHPDLDDGDAANDTEANLMFTSEGLAGDLQAVNGQLTPLQCITARASPHFLHTNGDTPLAPAAFARKARLLSVGDSVTDALTTRDAITAEAEEQFLDVYYLHGQAGDPVTIELASTDFDPVLLLEGPDGEQVAMDDDGGVDWNAQVRLTLPKSGDYSIGVTSVTRAVGAYQLTVSPAQ
jgi:hypothetical protein